MCIACLTYCNAAILEMAVMTPVMIILSTEAMEGLTDNDDRKETIRLERLERA